MQVQCGGREAVSQTKRSHRQFGGTGGVDHVAENGFGGADAHVVVRAVVTASRTRIEVEDNGPGIPEEHRARIFERFYRVDAGRSRALGGTGLGLSIVKHLAAQMGGAVGVRPGTPHGTVMWFDLPRAERPLAGASGEVSTPGFVG